MNILDTPVLCIRITCESISRSQVIRAVIVLEAKKLVAS